MKQALNRLLRLLLQVAEDVILLIALMAFVAWMRLILMAYDS